MASTSTIGGESALQSNRSQPEWKQPNSSSRVKLPPLRIYNSLTNVKNLFVPQQGRRVSWYSCGPTVYDSAHMGHARAYLTFDIIRRVLRDFFDFQVFYVMNITDIDDKIIKRARQNHLFRGYLEEKLTLLLDTSHNKGEDEKESVESFKKRLHTALHADLSESLKRARQRLAEEKDALKRQLLQKETNRVQEALNSISKWPSSAILSSSQSATANQNTAGDTTQTDDNKKQFVSAVLEEAKDALADLLDTKFGASVTQNSIFEELPQRFEREFHRDMDSLKILPADKLTRVSEFIPPIIEYCQTLIDNGFAYECADGSVYFDTHKFASSEDHFYAKLVPNAFGNQELLQEGEGVLSAPSPAANSSSSRENNSRGLPAEKRSAADFALWKRSKPGEPSWPSPWGGDDSSTGGERGSGGRPGWHIECSVMASHVLGPHMDVHSGGVDLKFPHHDNEMAQAEAYFGHSDWVRYFVHSGHLTIAGQKMSKSLKNFTSVAEALNAHSPDQIRLAFLASNWHDPFDYNAETMCAARSLERSIEDFLFSVNHILRGVVKMCASSSSNLNPENTETEQKENEEEKQLADKLAHTKTLVFEALCDSIDTKTAIEHLRALINASNTYIMSKSVPNPQLLHSIAKYIVAVFQVFGVGERREEGGNARFPLEFINPGGFVVDDDATSASQQPQQNGENDKKKNSKESLEPIRLNALSSNAIVEKTRKLHEVFAHFVEQLIKSTQQIELEQDRSEFLALAQPAQIQLTDAGTHTSGGELPAGNQLEAALQLELERLAELRLSVRSRALKTPKKFGAVLRVCDALRNDWLPRRVGGVRLQDRDEEERPAIGLYPDALLLESLPATSSIASGKKAANKSNAAAKAESVSASLVAPELLFKSGDYANCYSAYDEQGFPTLDANGKEITQSQSKKLRKILSTHTAKYEKLRIAAEKSTDK